MTSREQVVLTDGKNTLLANGFWGVSRHVNFLGEITQAVAVALAAGYSPRTTWRS